MIGAAALASERAMSLFTSMTDLANLYWLSMTSFGVGIWSAAHGFPLSQIMSQVLYHLRQ